MTETASPRPGWTVELFAAFWDDPDPRLVPPALTEDVIGYWAGIDRPVTGRDDYTQCIAKLIEALPDVRLSVAEHAESGEFVFVRWVMHATGANGPFEFSGIDRVQLRDGRVAENRVVFDTVAFETTAGVPVPWA